MKTIKIISHFTKKRWGIIILLTLILLWSCKEKGKTLKIFTLRIGTSKAAFAAPLLLACKFNFFKKQGLNVINKDHYKSGKAAFEAMLSGEVDVATLATTPATFISFKRKDFSIFATYSTSYDGVKIIARQNAGIKIAKDIKGKRVGVIKGTISHLLFTSFLVYNKISPYHVIIVNCKPSQIIAKFRKREIDAVSIWEPEAEKVIKSFSDAIRIPTKDIYRIAINLAAKKSYLKSNFEVSKKIVLALKETIDYINANKEHSVEIFSKMLNLNKVQVKKIFAECIFRLSLDKLLLITMELEAKWAIRYKYIRADKIPNFLKIINTKILEKINPAYVTINR